MSKKVLIPIADNSEELEAVTLINVLRRAGAEVAVASVGDLQILASRGVKIVADKLIDDCADEIYDLIVLPGGMPGAKNLRDSQTLKKMLIKQKQEGRLYAAICASPAIVLQSHGLLESKKATCYPGFVSELSNKEAVNQRVVIDGTCITSCGPGSALEFAIKLVELLYDKNTSAKIASSMLFT